MKTYALTISLVLNVCVVCGQSHSKQVDTYFTSIREKKNPPLPTALLNNRKNENDILSSVIPYLKDSVNEVRYSAYALIAAIGQQSTSSAFRKKAITALINGWRDKDSGINGLVASSLHQFKRTEYNNAAKDSLRALVKAIPPYYEELVKLCGRLNMTDQKNVIQSQLQTGSIKNRQDKWAAYLALSRLGDEQALSHIMTRVRKLKINDDVVYEVFPDIIYTRQRDAIAYVVEALHSEDKNCESADLEISENIPCAYRTMEYLAPVVKDFPLPISASGDLEVQDYKAALSQVRHWFTVNPDYEPLTNE